MRHRSKSLLATLALMAAFAIAGLTVLSSPAAAAEVVPAAEAGPFDWSSAVRIPVPASTESEVVESEARKRKWRGGWVWNLETGMYMAYVTNGSEAFAFGSYRTREEAENDGKARAARLNGVMDGPGCLPPFILC
ncbi:hypothetical protein KZZ52_49020 [Dactylosporangium sp. AC04546]|uniref:hypothetical protein n=1 Tax=Dactylosporangium sp. AC04546 TaxID=2862460 RepID=UPI002E7C4B7D|nr:hypothetical protein [Dactylosporangium sp. AC04546]WVK81831.1 hypothetical protein KZZ52_49020 [Dactylosporangium sp. AC04546]